MLNNCRFRNMRKRLFYDWHSLQSAGEIFVKNPEFFEK